MSEKDLTDHPPRKEDVLFLDGLPDWQNNACVNVTWGGDEFAYIEGFRRGARLLVESVMEQQNDQDYLVYPIIFLYRHHIELTLKEIIRHTPYLLNRLLTEAEEKHLARHRLDVLWQDLKPLLAEVCKAAGWNRMSTADEQGIGSHIRQLTALDPDSLSFRYTRSLKGERSLPAELKRINLRHFAETIERLADYLHMLDSAVSGLKERKMDMEAAYKNAYGHYA